MLIGTALAEELDRELGNKQGAPDYKMDLKDLSQGTAKHVVAAFDPQVDGEYSHPTSFIFCDRNSCT